MFYEKNWTEIRKRKPRRFSLICLPSSCKRKIVNCPFVDEETNGNYPLANGLNELNGVNGLSGLNGLAHLLFQAMFLSYISECI
jgi:hypothetical protein